jgi:hypothetical protein
MRSAANRSPDRAAILSREPYGVANAAEKLHLSDQVEAVCCPLDCYYMACRLLALRRAVAPLRPNIFDYKLVASGEQERYEEMRPYQLA